MAIEQKLKDIQEKLLQQKADGWLLYDHHGSNRFVRQLLEIPPHLILTRRFFYWIPSKGDPVKIVHKIEMQSVEFLPGQTIVYLSWQELEKAIQHVLKGSKQVIMEYAPRNANPYVSVVDGGTIELVRSYGVEVVSSANLLQHFTSVLDEKQIASHLEAASVLQTTLSRAWDLIADRLRSGSRITEYDVQKFLLSEFAAHDCITDDGPICAVNGHSALPHYIATKQSAKEILHGDFILIDLWCKKDLPYGAYADITRVAVAAAQPTPRQQEIFDIVKTAQNKAVDFIRSRIEAGLAVHGAEVDDICRNYIKACGYGKYFPHRTGHNIDTEVHGAGVHFDNLETSDFREVLPGMCFSVEPAIYLPEEFGMRIEFDLLIRHDRSIEITGGTEESLICLL